MVILEIKVEIRCQSSSKPYEYCKIGTKLVTLVWQLSSYTMLYMARQQHAKTTTVGSEVDQQRPPKLGISVDSRNFSSCRQMNQSVVTPDVQSALSKVDQANQRQNYPGTDRCHRYLSNSDKCSMDAEICKDTKLQLRVSYYRTFVFRRNCRQLLQSDYHLHISRLE